MFAVRTIEVGGASPRVATQVRRALAPTRGTSLLKVDLGARGAGGRVATDGRKCTLRPRVPPHPPRRRSCPSDRLPSPGRAPMRISSRGAAGSSPPSIVAIGPGSPGSGSSVTSSSRREPPRRASFGSPSAAVSPLAGSQVPRAGQLGHDDARRADAPAPLRARDPSRRPARRAAEARRGSPRDPSARGRTPPISTSPCRNGRSPEPSTLRSRLRVQPRQHLEVSVDNADKESVPWLRKPVGAHSIAR